MDGDSGLLRRRTTRTSRELTPEPTRKERVSKSSDRESKTQQPQYTADESKYIVRGVLSVGPPSPAGSTSSSGSGGHGASHSGSQAYRAKLLRYFCVSNVVMSILPLSRVSWVTECNRCDGRKWKGKLLNAFGCSITSIIRKTRFSKK